MVTTTDQLADPDEIIITRADQARAAAMARAQATMQAAKTGAAKAGTAAKTHGESLARRYWRGLRSARVDFIRYWNDDIGLEEARAIAPGKDRNEAMKLHDAKVHRNRSVTVRTAGAALGWLLNGLTDLRYLVDHGGPLDAILGWTLVAGVWLLLLGIASLVTRNIGDKKGNHGWLWPVTLWAIVASSAAAMFVHFAVGTPRYFPAVTLTAVALIWFAWAGRDGNLFAEVNADAGETVEVRKVDAPTTAPASEGNAVRALARGVGVKPRKGDAMVHPDDAAAEVTIIGTPAVDARGLWTRTHFQLQTRAFADLERGTSPSPMQMVATTLRRPTGWVFADRTGDDESQGLLYVASRHPWPTEPIRWGGLTQLEHDTWIPQPVGIDMLTGQPVGILIADTHDMCGASPGGGKTAWTRRELCALIADPHVDNVIADFKGDGALAMFAPACSTYVDGDDPATMREFAAWLRWMRTEEAPRRKAIMKDLVAAGLAPDAKLTRDIARNPEYGIKLMVVTVDEAQDGINDKTYGEQISEGLIYLGKQGRSIGVRLKIRTQKPTADKTGIPSALNSVLRTRIAGRAEDYQVSRATLLTSKLRADQMPDGVEGLFYLRLPGGRTEKVIAEYVDANDASAYVRRVLEHRGGPTPDGGQRTEPSATPEPDIPRVLLELHRLLSEPSREGRMLTVEVAAAMRAYGIVDVTDADRAGAKTDNQIAQEKVAEMIRPFGVVARPDKAAGNRMAYWLQREHRDLGEVGVAAAIERLRSGRPTGLRGASTGASHGSPPGSPRARGLHVV